jgi:hypothetical protein
MLWKLVLLYTDAQAKEGERLSGKMLWSKFWGAEIAPFPKEISRQLFCFEGKIATKTVTVKGNLHAITESKISKTQLVRQRNLQALIQWRTSAPCARHMSRKLWCILVMRPGALMVAERVDLCSTHACELSNITVVNVIQQFPHLTQLVRASQSVLAL